MSIGTRQFPWHLSLNPTANSTNSYPPLNVSGILTLFE